MLSLTTAVYKRRKKVRSLKHLTAMTADFLTDGWQYLVTCILALVAFALYYIYLTWNYNLWKEQNVPSIKPVPFLGTVKFVWKKTLHEQDFENHQKLGKVFGGFEGRLPVLYVIDPRVIRQITIQDFQVFMNRRNFSLADTDPVLRKIIALMRDDEWKITRSVLTPTFTTSKVKQMVPLIEECVEYLLTFLQSHTKSGQDINVKSFFAPFTLDVIASCAFAIKTNSVKDPNNEFTSRVRKFFRQPSGLMFFFAVFPEILDYVARPLKLLTGDPFHYFKQVTESVIDSRIKGLVPPRKDFLNILLEAQKNEDILDDDHTNGLNSKNINKVFTRNVMIAQCMVFLVAGHESMATTLTFLSYCLATNPDIQEKLISEIDQVLEKSRGEINYDIINSMPYLDMVLCETLRLYPPVTRIERVCSQDGYRVHDGLSLKKEVLIVTSIYSLHRDPELYPQPEIFDPERFTAENKARREACTYIPFGVGQRSCIAEIFALMNVKMAIVYILSKYRFKQSENTECPPKSFGVRVELLLPQSVTLVIEKRSDKHV